ncbi:cilia- and flagella-associated protein 68 [Pelodytes ibericus]
MSARLYSRPGFGSILHADGHGEVWTDLGPLTKFKQYGWRCTTKEDSYSNKSLMGNWNQERYDLCKLAERKPIPSQYDHYYQTSYSAAHPKKDAGRQVFKEEPHIFPGHQPELDTSPGKNLKRTCYMIDYSNPYTQPTIPHCGQDDCKYTSLHPVPLK